MVVTSPIGDQAPPALAAMIIIPANNQRSALSFISFRITAAITMEVVRLSKAAEKKKVVKAKIHISFTLFVVVILSVTTPKPPWASINSTMVIAPKRKNKIPAISARCSINSSLIKWLNPPASCACSTVPLKISGAPIISTVQQSTPVSSAEADLSIFIGCSRAIAV